MAFANFHYHKFKTSQFDATRSIAPLIGFISVNSLKYTGITIGAHGQIISAKKIRANSVAKFSYIPKINARRFLLGFGLSYGF